MSQPKKKDRRRWYSISVDTLRLLAFPVIVLLLAGVGWVGYGIWQDLRVQRQTTEVMGEVEVLLERLNSRDLRDNPLAQYQKAREKYRQASAAVELEDYANALPLAVESRDLLLAIRKELGVDTTSGGAQFLAVDGGVEFRRGERGRWQPARKDVLLEPGDYVRTSGQGSAQIFFPDGTFFTVRKNSQVVISHKPGKAGKSSDQTMEMEYGWVNLSTSKKPGKVRTPKAEARVDTASEVFVAFERSSGTGRYGTIRGSMEIQPDEGAPRRIGELQQVIQSGEEISAPLPLPRAPRLLGPPENFEINRDQMTSPLVLTWEPVEGAAGYALQVSDSHLFGRNIIEDMERSKSSARLGIRGEGSFVWQVAARSADGSLGPWSQPRHFRVASQTRGNAVEDDTPPPIEIRSVTAHGPIFIVRGQCEAGAIVSVNGEPVTVDADGAFTKAVMFNDDGPATIKILARDAWGNKAEERRRVFVENP